MRLIPCYLVQALNKLFSFILLVLIPYVCNAQLANNLLFRHLDQEDGLSDPNIKALHTDRDGFLWIGTENGLNRFDGSTCISYQKGAKNTDFPGSYITNIIEDTNGDLIIGSQQNLVRYIKKDETFSRYRFTGKPDFAHNHYTFPFYIDKTRKLWVYIAGNVYIYDKSKRSLKYFTTYSNGYIFPPIPMFQHLAWFVSRGVKGIYLSRTDDHKEKNVKQFFTGQSSAIKLTASIQDAYLASDSTFWLAGEHGLIRLNPLNGAFQTFNSFGKLKNIVATAVVKYPNKPWLIVGTSREGILLFNLQTNHFFAQYHHDPKNRYSLSGNNIRKIHLDNRHNIFIAVEGKGLDYGNLHQSVFPSLTPNLQPPELAHADVSTLLKCSNGNVLCGTRNEGLIVYNQDMKGVLAHLLGHAEIKRLSPLSDKQIMVELANGKQYAYDVNTSVLKLLKLQSLPGSSTRFQMNQIEKFNQRVYAATEYGLGEITFNKERITLALDKQFNSTLHWPNIQQIIPISPDSLLVQTYYTALYLYVYQNHKFTSVREICRTPYAINESTIANRKLYLATTQGLLKMSISNLAEPVKLLESNCSGLVYTNGAIWTVGNSGLFKYDIKHKMATYFSRRDGLKNISFAPQTMLLLNPNLMVVGSDQGINIFNPNTLKPYRSTAQPKITDFTVNNEHYKLAGNPVMCKKITLEDTENTFSIAFSSMDYIAPEKREIRYRMIGYDKADIIHFGNGLVRYPNMPAGNYRFELKDVISGTVTFLNIQVLAPFWQKWWFITAIAAVLLVLCALSLWFYLRWINQLQSSQLRQMINFQKSDRKRIADELHDDLGIKLSSLKHYLIAGDINKMIDRGMLRALATEYIDGALSVLRSTLINLSPKTLDQEGLILALADLMESISHTPSLKIHFDYGSFNDQLLSTQQYALYRICQELLNNTLKHSGAKNIYLSIVSFPNSTVLLFEDDGKGFDYEQVKRGYGLYNMEAYVKAIRADLDIQSAAGKGVAVTIIVENKTRKR